MRVSQVGAYTTRGSSMDGVMANTEFGPVVAKVHGLYVEIPQSCINKDGMPRVNIRRKLKEGFTKQNVAYLIDKGCKIYID